MEGRTNKSADRDSMQTWRFSVLFGRMRTLSPRIGRQACVSGPTEAGRIQVICQTNRYEPIRLKTMIRRKGQAFPHRMTRPIVTGGEPLGRLFPPASRHLGMARKGVLKGGSNHD